MTDQTFRRHGTRLLTAVWISTLCFAWSYSTPAFTQGDALETPARPTELAEHSLVLDITRTGDRLFAVGERGHIIWTDNLNSLSWEQSAVPVRTTLTSCFFADSNIGWAVGHDGVVLKTEDGGLTWHTQLNGFEANKLMAQHATALRAQAEQALSDAAPEETSARQEAFEAAEYGAQDAISFLEEGASRPFLDVWFQNEQEGFVIGAFGLILRTIDGGESWTPWFDRLDNPYSLHLNSIRKIGQALYITAEAGALFRSTDNGQTWQRLDSPYDGSLFGILGSGDGRLITFGLRGHVFQSLDGGDSWTEIETGTSSSLFGGTLLPDGTAVLVGTQGVTVFIDRNGHVGEIRQADNRLPLSQVISLETELLTVGLGGIQAQPLTHDQ
ncbi:YCF48-related protein [Marinobacter sp. tcs-11]|uniref:WD40/YVTN/BNR-like repeat-containing protein n=1 Tax=Marinobacter sp. tcs-11 TaxID=1742860 RepID=UPI00257FFC67|nr:YCF48-related protein [Marinobacter sp. tcs-11]